jgi:hypothetical protein
VIIQVNDNTLVIAPGINSKKDMEAKVVFLSREINRKPLRKNRFSGVWNDDFQRANAAFDSIYPSVLKWSNLTTFPAGKKQ